MGDTWWVIIICPCINVFSLMGGVTEADVGFPTVIPILLFEYFKEVLIDIIDNITGGIIDFSINDNGSVMQVPFKYVIGRA
jgi:hypothetical protein